MLYGLAIPMGVGVAFAFGGLQMSDQHRTLGHARHGLPGPHFAPTDEFLPLGLYIVENRVHVEVTRPRVIVGRRSDCDLCLGFPEVSRRHCEFAYGDRKWTIHDLKSLNGVYLNDELVVDAMLSAGDRIRIGTVELLVESIAGVKSTRKEPARHAILRQIVDVLPAKPE